MFDLDKWQEIFATMQKNKLRTFLTAFGVFWGIFMLVVLLGAGKGMQNGVKREFAGEATNALWIDNGKTSIPYAGLQPGRRIEFDVRDMEIVQTQFGKSIDLMTPRNFMRGEYTLEWKDKNGSFRLYGTNQNWNKLNGEEVTSGRWLNPLDVQKQRKVIIIGDRVKEVLFGDSLNPMGEYITVKGVHFQVVGTFHTNGNNGRNEERAYVPISTFQNTFGDRNTINFFGVTTQTGVDITALEDKIRNTLSKKHKFSPEDTQAVEFYNNQENYDRFNGLFDSISIFIWFIGVGTLIAGIVGVSNVMLIIVKERTKEIGVRKAMGATPFSIVSLIVQESIFITAISGYFGLLSATGLLYGLQILIQQMESSGGQAPYFTRPEVDLSVAVSALVILVLSGAIAGLFPAVKAAKVKPIEALRAD